MWQILTVVALLSCVAALDNGLARTPPMGWLAWERFRCNIDCKNDPDNCISENLFKAMADRVAADGFKDAGYEYVIMDDCWLAKDRAPDGNLQPDAERFPSGVKALADYVHSKGLKFGIYEDFGVKTCAGYPGVEYHLQMDAQQFANWGVDYVKLDGCNSYIQQMDNAYPAFGAEMNRTNRPMVYSCSWPAYQHGTMTPDYPAIARTCNLARNSYDIQDSWKSVMGTVEQYGENKGDFASQARPGFWNDPDMAIAKSCNLWRNFNDIADSWDSVESIIEYYGNDSPGNFSNVAGPGNFNDPDMLIIGNFGLSYDQQRAQMAMWAIMASPLIMSNDLRSLRPESKEILLNRRVIAINQDALGVQGTRKSKLGNIQLWTRPILPKGSLAFVFLNTGNGGGASKVSFSAKDIGLTDPKGYNLTEAFDGTHMGFLKPGQQFQCNVNPTGVCLVKAVLMS